MAVSCFNGVAEKVQYNDNLVLSLQRTDVAAITIEKKNQSIQRRVTTKENEDGDDIEDLEDAVTGAVPDSRFMAKAMMQSLARKAASRPIPNTTKPKPVLLGTINCSIEPKFYGTVGVDESHSEHVARQMTHGSASSLITTSREREPGRGSPSVLGLRRAGGEVAYERAGWVGQLAQPARLASARASWPLWVATSGLELSSTKVGSTLTNFGWARAGWFSSLI
ncbi:hypothetical protein KSP39_PZI002060 [Platanthera zijinensis]|uniref:Uncharacterized protein n=1 Tax=Platanthera zijinensis TaxID=2320716 RepID=A0AAP0BXX3_9ASPA